MVHYAVTRGGYGGGTGEEQRRAYERADEKWATFIKDVVEELKKEKNSAKPPPGNVSSDLSKPAIGTYYC